MKHNEPDPESQLGSRGRRMRICTKCKLYQPPGTAHCVDCGVCVKGYDHHCGFMGQCVGKLNLFPFYCFLINIFVTVVFMLFATFPALNKNNRG